MTLLGLALLAIALAGHTGLWTTFVNRLHATTLPKSGVNVVNVIGLGTLCALPPICLWLVATRGVAWLWQPNHDAALDLARWYALAGLPLGCYALAAWGKRRFLTRRPTALRRERDELIDLQKRLGGRLATGFRGLMAALPGNQCFQLVISEKELALPRLAPGLDGLTIAHVSDLHFTGSIDKRHFSEVVRLTNQLKCDMVLITGDIVDKAQCIDWIPETLGKLAAPMGVFAILGNHDVRLKSQVSRLVQALVDNGIEYVGGRWTRLRAPGGSIILAGNELPWIRPAADMGTSPSAAAEPQTLRILLAHSPDEYEWARRRQFDLMLAGHNHGGQICLPLIGPLFSPSRYGVKYASGTFDEPPTVLHVSRGISAMDPLRYNCPPELTKLVLRSPVALVESAEATATAAVSERRD